MRKVRPFSKRQAEKCLKQFPEWKLNPKGTMLSRTFSFSDFITALAFVGRVTVYAEMMNHHPDIELSYGKVKVKLTTHDAKGLTEKDFKLAEVIGGLA